MRSAPIPSDGDVGSVHNALWAIYFWCERNGEAMDLWKAVSAQFAPQIAHLIQSEHLQIARLAMDACAYLWLMPTETKRQIVEKMKCKFPLERVAELIVESAAEPDVSMSAILLVCNFIAYDKGNFLCTTFCVHF
jgi:hypothetical protein